MSTPDFGYIAAMKVTDDTEAEFVFTTLPGEPSLICKPAISKNRAFQAAQARAVVLEVERQKRGVKRSAKRAKDMIPTADDEEEGRDKDRVIYAATCISKWGVPPPDGSSGKPVEFSQENVLAFLRALPDVMYISFSNWLINEWNFLGESQLPAGAGAALGESSPTG